MYKFHVFELWNEEITLCSLKGQREKIQACQPGFRQLKIRNVQFFKAFFQLQMFKMRPHSR